MKDELRLFIAIHIPRQLCEQLSRTGRDTIEERHRVSWVRAEAMHLTLKFLGDTPVTSLKELQEILERVAACNPVCELYPQSPGLFRQREVPRVLWWGLAGDVIKLEQLAATLEEELSDAGFPKSDKPFKPHITLGRVKRGERDMADRYLQAGLPEESPIVVESIQLIQSTLHSDGARYRLISRHMLKTSTG
jgi:RNA 2',3'-cyclic 3'-phosphodiesterase